MSFARADFGDNTCRVKHGNMYQKEQAKDAARKCSLFSPHSAAHMRSAQALAHMMQTH